MGRPPNSGLPVFRFTQDEVAEMEAILRDGNNAIPSRHTISALANKFSASTGRIGKTAIQTKQVWNWFQNRRYAQRAKMIKATVKLSVSPIHQEDSLPYRSVSNSVAAVPGSSSESSNMEFEARSARDGAWYDVAAFLSHRIHDFEDPEVKIRYTGFENEEEWINIRKCLRLRSLPCESSECVVVLPGDLVLCFQESKDQALYFDAHVLDAQRRRHDVRGCRCRFLVRYDHDQSEEIVHLRKICRRPETDYRLQLLHTSKALGPVEKKTNDASCFGSPKELDMTGQKQRNLHQTMDNNINDVMAPTHSSKETVTIAIPPEKSRNAYFDSEPLSS